MTRRLCCGGVEICVVGSAWDVLADGLEAAEAEAGERDVGDVVLMEWTIGKRNFESFGRIWAGGKVRLNDFSVVDAPLWTLVSSW